MKTVKVNGGGGFVSHLVSVDQLSLHYIPVEFTAGTWERSAYFGLYNIKDTGEHWWDALIHYRRDTPNWNGRRGEPTMVYENMVTPPGWQHFDLLNGAHLAGYDDDRALWWIRLDIWARAIEYEAKNPIEACYVSDDIALPNHQTPVRPSRDNPYMQGVCFRVYRGNPRKRYYRGDRLRGR